MDYLRWLEEEKKISSDVASRFGVKQGSNMFGKPCLAFDYVKGGKLSYVKWRWQEKGGGKDFRRDRSGVPTQMWQLDQLYDGNPETVVITEGEIDCLSVLSAGYYPCVSVPDGAQLSEEGQGDINPETDKSFEWLWEGDKLLKPLQAAKKIILAVDRDDKGKVLRSELSIRIGRNKCWFVRYPKGCNDPNDVLRLHGEEALKKMLDEASPMVSDRLVDVSAFEAKDIPKSYYLSVDELEKYHVFSPPSFCVMTGPPGAGKSQWVSFLTGCYARDFGVRSAVIQFEDSSAKVRENYMSFAKTIKGLDSVEDRYEWVKENFRFFDTELFDESEESLTLDWLIATIEQAAYRHNCKCVVVDPWNEIEHLWPRSETETQYLNKALSQLRRLTRKLGIMLIVVAHPDKASGQNKKIEDWTLYSISGGTAWYNKADQGIVILPSDDEELGDDCCYFKNAKIKDVSRFGRMRNKHVCMRFLPNTASFACVKGPI